jgi:hypothetical protein
LYFDVSYRPVLGLGLHRLINICRLIRSYVSKYVAKRRLHTKTVNKCFCLRKCLYFFVYKAKIYNDHMGPCKLAFLSKYSCSRPGMHPNSLVRYKLSYFFQLNIVYFNRLKRYAYRRMSIFNERWNWNFLFVSCSTIFQVLSLHLRKQLAAMEFDNYENCFLLDKSDPSCLMHACF